MNIHETMYEFDIALTIALLISVFYFACICKSMSSFCIVDILCVDVFFSWSFAVLMWEIETEGKYVQQLGSQASTCLPCF